MTHRFSSWAPLLAACLPLAPALAGGFQTPPQSAFALGLAGAVTASAHDASAAWFNPGALARLDSADLTLGVSGLRAGHVFRSATTDQVVTADAQWLVLPHVYAALPLGKDHRFVAGFSLNQPFGYDTKWAADWQGRALVTESRLRSAVAQPTLGWRVTDRFSIGAGVMIAAADLQHDRAIGELAGATAHYEAKGVGIGANVGIQGQIGDYVSFGITYRTSTKVKFNDGTAEFRGVPSSQTGRYPSSAPFTSTLHLPSTLAAGISNRVNNRLVLNFTFELTGWSVYDSLNYQYKDAKLGTERNPHRWEDAMAFRVGANYEFNDNLTLRAGLYYDESPVRDQNITPELPDANVLGGTLGLGYRLGSRLRLDAAYTYGYSAERVSRADFTVVDLPAVGGNYRNNQHGAALGLGYQF